VAAAVAVAGRVGQRAAPGSVEAATGLHRRGVEQHKRIACARRALGEDRAQPLERVTQPGSAFVQRALGRQVREELADLPPRGPQEAPVGGLVHDHLRDTQRQHLSVCELALRVLGRLRQEVVRRAVNTDQQQLEVGVHRSGPSRVDDWVSSADFELFVTDPAPPTAAYTAESII
jgi:hypothetical protein